MDGPVSLIVIGLALLAGWVAHEVGRRAHVPRITLLLLIGVALGPIGLDVVPAGFSAWFPPLATAALSMVGFLLGRHLQWSQLRRTGATILSVSLLGALVPAALVAAVLLALGVDPVVATLLAGISAATAPAATIDVIRETGARGPVSEALYSVVALDDVWAVLLFSVLLTVAQTFTGADLSGALVASALLHVFGAVALGALLGLPMAFLTGRIRAGDVTLIETLGFVLLTGGVAMALEVSYLIACMVAGAVVANRGHHHERAFHAIEGASEPFLVVFFLVAGFELDATALVGVGLTGVAYLLARAAGKVMGAALGARVVRGDPHVQRHLGWCLLPQAGVALGMALLAAQRFPEHGPSVLSLLVATTVVFEVVGPIATRIALVRAGEVSAAHSTGRGGA